MGVGGMGHLCLNVGFCKKGSLIKIIRDAASYKSLLAQHNLQLIGINHLSSLDHRTAPGWCQSGNPGGDNRQR